MSSCQTMLHLSSLMQLILYLYFFVFSSKQLY